MNDRDRLEQLRALLVRLERSPASAERDRMLGEVRARVVDVETGETPAAPAVSPKPRRASPRPTRGAPRARPVPPPPRMPPPAPLAATPPRAAHDLLEEGVMLCLDDQPLPADGTSRPWARGLRG
jgi:hypothetical protein